MTPYMHEQRHKTPDKMEMYARDDRSAGTNHMYENPSSSGRSSGLVEQAS